MTHSIDVEGQEIALPHGKFTIGEMLFLAKWAFDFPEFNEGVVDGIENIVLAPIMAAVGMAESGGDPNAVGDADTAYPSYGLWQIRLLPSRKAEGATAENLKNPRINAYWMAKIAKGQGLKAWTQYANGAYKDFLEAAQGADPEFVPTGNPGEDLGGIKNPFDSWVGELLAGLAGWLGPSLKRIGVAIAGGLMILLTLLVLFFSMKEGAKA